MTDEPVVDDSGVSEPDEIPRESADAFAGPEWNADGRVRVRRRRRRKSRRRILIGLGALALLVIAAVLWLVYTGYRARAELEGARAGVHAMRADIAAGDLDAARTDAR